MRIKATIAYDGSKFYGFQKQKQTKNTIFETIQEALKSLGIETKIIGSGRTDRGVHATGQVIHFDIPPYWEKKSIYELQNRLNQKLNYIHFNFLKEVDSSFHAQYSAKIRVYRYLIKENVTVFEKDYISQYIIKDINLFKKALNLYIGKHNFKNFKKEGSYTSSDIREVYKIKVIKIKDIYAIYFFANGYLRSQIRMMIEGALKVSNKEITITQLKEQLELKRVHFRTLATPQGLYLNRIFY